MEQRRSTIEYKCQISKCLNHRRKSNVAIEETLLGWFEIIDASRFGGRIPVVVAALDALAIEYPGMVREELTTSPPEDGGMLLRYSFTWCNESPPDFEDLFSN